MRYYKMHSATYKSSLLSICILSISVLKPFIWTSEPEFVAANMGIDDAMYS